MIYIHIPFCASKCHYCDFYSVASKHLVDPVLRAIADEITAERDFLSGTPPHTIYFGGGTPSALTIVQVGHLVEALHNNFDLSAVEEFTFEANPEHLNEEYLSGLKSSAVNRLSVGVQSFFDDHLTQMNRRHSAACAVEAVRAARAAGFDNISIDLIYGLPFMSDEQWLENIDRAVELGVEHISAYHLSIEERTVFHRQGLQSIDQERSEWQYNALCSKLLEAGFAHYEISNFALDGRHSRHNSGYWSGESYLGLGPSAHSFDGRDMRRWNVSNNAQYVAHASPESEHLSPADHHNEYLMTRLRTAAGVDLTEYEALFGRRLDLPTPFQTLGNRAFIPESEWLVADALIAPLFI